MERVEQFRDKILREYPRLSLQSKFRFACNPEVPCFGRCCANVNIFLTPYDVLRMKNALGIPSAEFLERYTIPLMLEGAQLPVVVLKMGDDEQKKCPFVSDRGCTIYDDRPWSCRMYPLGLASSRTAGDEGEEFCFVVEEDDSLCQGFKQDTEWTVEGWLKDQDVDVFNRKSESYMRLTLHPHLLKNKVLDEKKIPVFFKTCYDLDGFRERLFKSSFFDRFEVSEDVKEAMRTDDEALMEFGITKWLRFALFHEDTMIVRDEELERGAKSLGWSVEQEDIS
jgi:Fe-S-cluster containining protein